MSDRAAVIEAQNVVKAYGDVKVLRDVSLEVRRGEICGFRWLL